jgi:hypothetical protein
MRADGQSAAAMTLSALAARRGDIRFWLNHFAQRAAEDRLKTASMSG